MISWSSDFKPRYLNHELNVMVFQPSSRVTDVPVLWCNGFGAGATGAATALEMLGTVLTGVVVASASLTSTNQHFGNQDSLDALDDEVAWLAANYGTRTDKVALMGGSMGGWPALNWARYNLSKVAAIAVSIPGVSLQGTHDRNPLGLAPTIEAAYGGLAGYTAALETHDPGRHPELYTGIADKVRLWYSSTDAVVTAAECTAFATAAGVTAIDFGPYGHVSPSDPALGADVYWQEIVDWFAPLVWRA